MYKKGKGDIVLGDARPGGGCARGARAVDHNTISLLVCLSEDLSAMKTDKVGIRDVTGALAVRAADWLQVGAEELFMPLGSIRRIQLPTRGGRTEAKVRKTRPTAQRCSWSRRHAILLTVCCLLFPVYRQLFALCHSIVLVTSGAFRTAWRGRIRERVGSGVGRGDADARCMGALGACNSPGRLLGPTCLFLDYVSCT